MARVNAAMRKILEYRERLAAELADAERKVEALRNQLLGIDRAMRAEKGDDSLITAPTRRNVKKTILDLVQRAGRDGINASEIVEQAALMGRELDRKSVSSLLSRFKREGVLTFDGERYHAFVPPQEPAATLKVIKSAA